MAWSAKITDKSLSEGRLSITVELKNGSKLFGEKFIVSNAQGPSWLKDRINERIDVLNKLSAYEASLGLGDVDLTPDPITPPPTPTQAELNRAKWAEDYNKLQKLETLLTKKLIKSNDAELLALRTSVEADFKPEYADIVGQ